MTRLVAVGLAAVFALPTKAAPAPSVDEVLSHVRAAVGYEKMHKQPALEMRGKINQYGKNAEYRLTFDNKGRFREVIDGKLGETVGYDGAICWTTDWSRATRRFDLGDRERALVTQWVQTGYWLTPNGPFKITVNAKKTTDAEVVLSLRLVDGLFSWRLTIDRKTWLPKRLQRTEHGDPQTMDFDDYQATAAGLIARRIKQKGSEEEFTVRVEKVEPGASVDDELFRFVPRAPNNVKFDDSQPAQLKVKRAQSGHLLVRPLINGKDVGWFIFDTGAGISAIDKSVAASLGMELLGDVPALGMGGTTQSRVRQDHSLQLGPVTLTNNLYIELDLKPFWLVMGEKIAGVVGYQMIEASVVEIEVAKPAISLHNPAAYKLSGGEWGALVLNDNHPCCQARFEGDREGIFRLDTGATDTVGFHTPAVKRLGLLKDRKTSVAFEGGVGGMKPTKLGRIDWFELGGHRFKRPKVTFSTATDGAMMDDCTLGNIGQEFLKPFRLVLWYQGQKIAFVELPKRE